MPEVKIKLNFIDPKIISSGIEPDIIQAFITEDVNIQRETYMTLLKKGTTAKKEIPP